MRKISLFFLMSIFACLLTACGSSAYYQELNNFEDKTWLFKNNIAFEFEIKPDATTSYDLSLLLRYDLSFKYANFYYQYSLINEQGQTLKNERQEVQLFQPKTGEPTGKGSAGTYEVLSTFLSNYKLEPGKYKLIVSHQMRQDVVLGISSILFSVDTPK